MERAIFLDRDGTINIDSEFVHRIEDFTIIQGAVQALHNLQSLGYLLIVVTNQSGIGRGYFSVDEYQTLTDYMLSDLAKMGIMIRKVYMCPHLPEDGCTCRKPGIKLYQDAIHQYRVDVGRSYVIGDTVADIQAGKTIGCRTILVRTGKGKRYHTKNIKPDHIAPDLLAASKWIKQNE